MKKPTAHKPKPRVQGYDLARGIAIISMVLVNYRLAIVHPEYASPHWFIWLTELFPCREAAMFVILAGIGTSLSAWQQDNAGTPIVVDKARKRLIYRAFVLMGIGILNSILWNADILRFFALYMLAGTLLLYRPKRQLFIAIGFSMAAFPVLLLLGDYDQGWHFANMEYPAYFTFAGFFRGLIFNGHHPILPWLSFYLFGMILGRLDLAGNARLRHKILWISATVALAAELVSFLLLWVLKPNVTATELPDLIALLGREPFPPMPLFVLQAGGTATVVIMLCLEATAHIKESRWTRPLIHLGQLSLTIYVAHAWIGLGVLIPFGVVENSTPTVAAWAGFVFIFLATWFASVWRRRSRPGPLEWILRRIAS